MPGECESVPRCIQYSNALIAASEQKMQTLTASLYDGKIDVGEWQITMREELRRINAFQLIAGAGGSKDNVESDDWLKLGTILKSQYAYLEDFAREIAAGNVSAAQANARSALYARSARQSFWAQSTGELDLPAQPGDGTSECLGSCGCMWAVDYEYDDAGQVTAALCYWTRGKSDSCPTCLDREDKWQPLRIEIPKDYEPRGIAERSAYD